MEFIPETLEALDELDPLVDDDGSLPDRLARMAAQAQVIAPDLVGMSLTFLTHGITLTLVATDDEIAALDAMHHVTGPSTETVDDGEGPATTGGDLLDEVQWHDLAVAAVGVRSTLTFPIMEAGQLIGTVNLYGRFDDTFVGRHQALADTVQAWAPGAVTNADLGHTSRPSRHSVRPSDRRPPQQERRRRSYRLTQGPRVRRSAVQRPARPPQA